MLFTIDDGTLGVPKNVNFSSLYLVSLILIVYFFRHNEPSKDICMFCNFRNLCSINNWCSIVEKTITTRRASRWRRRNGLVCWFAKPSLVEFLCLQNMVRWRNRWSQAPTTRRRSSRSMNAIRAFNYFMINCSFEQAIDLQQIKCQIQVFLKLYIFEL